MADIYRTATTILIWLGHSAVEEAAIVNISKVVRVIRYSANGLTPTNYQRLASCVVLYAIVTRFYLWKRWALRQVDVKNYKRLHMLLQDFDTFGCAEGRDRIFAVAALAADVDLLTCDSLPAY